MRNPSPSLQGPAFRASTHTDIGARVMLVFLSLIWGITWPVMRIALNEIPPVTMRATATVLGAATYYLLCVAMRRRLLIRSPKVWAHIVIASLLNVVAFSLFSAFAQLAATTSRVAILAYTMPIWAVLLAWTFLGERPNRLQAIALLLCATGLGILIYPLAANGIPRGIVFAIAIGVCWAGGTVYLKWAQIQADQMGVGSWQLTVAAVILVVCMLIFDGRPHFREVHPDGALATAWTGIVVHHHPALARHHGLARRARIPGDRRRRLFFHSWRSADRRGHNGVCPDLRRLGLRIAEPAEASTSGSRVS